MSACSSSQSFYSASSSVASDYDQILGEFVWTIKIWPHLSRNVENADAIESPVFTVSNYNSNFEWQLQLYPNGTDSESSDFLSIYLISCNKSLVEASCAFSLMNNDDKAVYTRVLEMSIFSKKNFAWGLPRFIQAGTMKNEHNQMVLGNHLKISCEILINVVNCINVQSRPYQSSVPKCHNRLKEFDDLERLVDNDLFSDVIFQIDGKQINSHKCILANKSIVFETMFSISMKESKQSIVDIVDIRYDVFKEMLRFIYTAKVYRIEEIADQLIAAAEKYSLQELKNMCEMTLFKNLTVEKATQSLEIGFLYNANILKEAALNLISYHKLEIINSPSFKKLEESYPHLMSEIVKVLANSEKNVKQ